MKKLAVIIAFAAISCFSDCTISDYSYSRPCYFVSDTFPTFTDGRPMEIGEWSCATNFGESKETDETKRNGIPVTKMIRVMPCKKIIDIRVDTKVKTEYGRESRYIPVYAIIYGAETHYAPDPVWGEWYVVRKTRDMVYEGDAIEIFRKNGTLRYRGRIIKDGDISTVGDCYNSTGNARTRHTNNADTCK
jgi:hypothetical protein